MVFLLHQCLVCWFLHNSPSTTIYLCYQIRTPLLYLVIPPSPLPIKLFFNFLAVMSAVSGLQGAVPGFNTGHLSCFIPYIFWINVYGVPLSQNARYSIITFKEIFWLLKLSMQMQLFLSQYWFWFACFPYKDLELAKLVFCLLLLWDFGSSVWVPLEYTTCWSMISLC